MGIRFACPNGHKLNVKSELAGTHPYRKWLDRTQLILEELKPVFDYAARYKKGLPVFLEHLQALLGRYPEIAGSPNWEAIVEHICTLAVEQLPFEIAPKDIYNFLEQEAE